MIPHHEIDDGPLHSKLHKVWCAPGCCLPCNCLFRPCRSAVSRKKRRYTQNGFDLDLVYLTDRIIVHGFPANGLEHIYRNPRLEIKRFLDLNHENHYMLYNFCCEPGRGYDPEIFYGRVRRYPFKDHTTPPLKTLVAFANDVKAWLEDDPKNVVSMHCKAGKGRAGLMSCVALVRTGVCQSALEAMDKYDAERVTNNRGLTVTSQRKYVIFYELLWRKVWAVSGDIGAVPAVRDENDTRFALPEEPEINIYGVELLFNSDSKPSNYQIKIYQGTNFNPEERVSEGLVDPKDPLKWSCDCKVKGNFKIYVYRRTLFSKKKVLEMWHNTLFMTIDSGVVDFGVDQIDIKKGVLAKLGKDLVLRLHLSKSIGQQDSTSTGDEGKIELSRIVPTTDAAIYYPEGSEPL